MQPARKVSERCGALIVRMRGHEKDPRRNPGAFYRFVRFRQAGTCPRRWRKLRERGSGQKLTGSAARQNTNRQTSKIGIHATSTACQVTIITVNPQPEPADFQA